MMLVKSLDAANNLTSTESMHFYPYDLQYVPTGHRGMGVTFDADSLSKIEY